MRFAGAPQITDFLARKENYENLADQGIRERAAQNIAVMEAEGLMSRSEIEADAMVKAAKYGASATRAQGAAQGQSSLVSGITSGLSGLGGALKGKFGGPGTMSNPNFDNSKWGSAQSRFNNFYKNY